ncbi:heparanase-like [Diadema setosum]|uniref:heparanase-like n=1 Tax=Diadema setosum TaxID=31175 RepID=UPI003B3A389C
MLESRRSLPLAGVVSLLVLAALVWRGPLDIYVRRLQKGADVVFHNRLAGSTKREELSVVMVTVNTATALRSVDERFVSVGSTMASIHRSFTFDSQRFHTAARGLSPAVFRIGGALADFTRFEDVNDEGSLHGKKKQKKKSKKLFFYSLCGTAHTWDKLNEFARSVGWEIAFCLNVLLRNGSDWDPTNAVKLIEYTAKKGYQVLWSLGNEPNGFLRKANVSLTPQQIANSFRLLRNIISSTPSLRGAFIFGPDTSSPVKLKSNNTLVDPKEYLQEFLQNVGRSTNVTSFHFYYTNGRTIGLLDYLSPHTADILLPNMDIVRQLVEDNRPADRSKIWLTETGATFGGDAGVENTFVDGFLLLDKLGVSARYGADLVVQQNLAGASGGVLDSSAGYYPRLKFWLLLYHKRLMGVRVLNVTHDVDEGALSMDYPTRQRHFNFTSYYRIYAHCTKISPMYSRGAITLMVINMDSVHQTRLVLPGALRHSIVHEYLFTPHGSMGILAENAKMNGQPLVMPDDATLPYHAPRELTAGSPIVLLPQTYGFFVMPQANVSACL